MDAEKKSWDKVGRGDFIMRSNMMSRVRKYEENNAMSETATMIK